MFAFAVLLALASSTARHSSVLASSAGSSHGAWHYPVRTGIEHPPACKAPVAANTSSSWTNPAQFYAQVEITGGPGGDLLGAEQFVQASDGGCTIQGPCNHQICINSGGFCRFDHPTQQCVLSDPNNHCGTCTCAR